MMIWNTNKKGWERIRMREECKETKGTEKKRIKKC
jgi:hypothetical protein